MPDSAPGPHAWPWLGHALGFVRDGPAFLLACQRRYGDSVALELRGPTLLVTAPDDVRHVLVGNPNNFIKSERVVSESARRQLGDNVLTSDGERHAQLRAALRPWFQSEALTALAPTFVGCARRALGEWQARPAIELSAACDRLVAECIVAGLLGEAAGREVVDLVERRRRSIEALFSPLQPWPARAARRDAAVAAELRAAVARALGSAALPALTGRALAEPLDRASLCEQVVSLLLAGYETTSAHLAWTLYALAQRPELQRRAAAGDAREPWFDWIASESLRLYPPTWMFVRVARSADRLPSGIAIAAGTKIYLSQYVSHRRAAAFADADHFRPERFASPPSPFSYFPFGGGARFCLGEALARSLVAVLLREIVGGAELRTPSSAPPRHRAGLTLRLVSAARVSVVARGRSPR